MKTFVIVAVIIVVVPPVIRWLFASERFDDPKGWRE